MDKKKKSLDPQKKEKKEILEHNRKLGLVIKEMREQLGLSQYGLSSRVSLDRSFISLLEHGERSATLNTIFRLAKAFNLTPSQLVRKCEVYKEPKKEKVIDPD